MKILLLSEFFPSSNPPELTGGVEARNFYLAKHLSEKNQITVLCSKNDKFQENFFLEYKFKINPIGLRMSYTQSGSFLKRIFFMLSCVFSGLKNDFDVIDASNFITYLPAIILGFVKKKPVVLWYADVWLGKWKKNIGFSGIFGELLENLSLFLSKKAKFIAISKFTKQNLIKHKIKKENITIIPLGVEQNEIQERKEKKYDIVAVNRLVKYKNTNEIIDAIKIIKDRFFENIKAVIIGDGPEKFNLVNAIKKFHLEDNVEIVSGQEHEAVMSFISKSKVFVSASQVEGFGIAPVEAAACGLPCVLKSIPVYKEHEKNLKGAVLFQNSSELASLIIKLLRDDKIYAKLSELNKKNSLRYFWSEISKETEEIYKSLTIYV